MLLMRSAGMCAGIPHHCFLQEAVLLLVVGTHGVLEVSPLITMSVTICEILRQTGVTTYGLT
jgi:hypothetical protein